MRSVLVPFYDPNVFANMGQADDADSGDESSDQGAVKMTFVSGAIQDPGWWVYGDMVASVGAGPQALIMFSRMCPCHPLTQTVESHGDHVWRAQLRKETGGHDTCPGAGLVAADFVAGKHREVLETCYMKEEQSLYILLVDLLAAVRDEILRDWDIGRNVVVYVVDLKFSVYMQLPLRTMGLAHRDEDVARQIGLEIKRQFDQTRNSTQHHAKVLALMNSEKVLGQEFVSFLEGAARSSLPSLARFTLPFRVISVNELSAERLQKDRTNAEALAPLHTAAFASHKLRARELNEDRVDFDTLAAAVARTRSDFLVVNEFQLQRHPTLARWKQDQIALGNRLRSGRCGSVRLVREVFYHVDIPALFTRNGQVMQNVADAVKMRDKDKEMLSEDPLGSFKAAPSDSIDAEKVEDVLMCRYALKHFREQAKQGELFSCPKAQAVEELCDVLSGPTVAHKLDDSGWIPVLSECVAQVGNQQVFRVMHCSPASQNLMHSPTSTLRTGRIAVAKYNMVAFNVDGGASFHVSADMSGHSNVRLLSLQTFLEIGMQKLKTYFFRCKEATSARYFLKSAVMPAERECIRKMPDVVTALMNAEAYPGPFKKFWPPTGDIDFMSCLDALKLSGLVDELEGGFWQLTGAAMDNIVHARLVEEVKPLFERRRCAPKGMTQWEMLDLLKERQWSFVLQPFRKQIAPVVLDRSRPAVDKVFFSQKKVEVSKFYLQALLDNHRLALEGKRGF